MHYHKKNYFKGGVSESAKIKVHTIDYIRRFLEAPFFTHMHILFTSYVMYCITLSFHGT